MAGGPAYARRVTFARRQLSESTAAFHARPLVPTPRELWVPCLDDATTLVLGSSQNVETIDRSQLATKGIELTRRRSGGGAVLVSRHDVVWFDVVLPHGDPLWNDDVGQAFHWLGEAVRTALADLGLDTEVHTGRPIETEWSTRLCFAGVGHGELLLDGRKLVGISQRRTRDMARFQVALLRRWSGSTHADLLALSDTERPRAARRLDALAVGVDLEPDRVIGAVSEALP